MTTASKRRANGIETLRSLGGGSFDPERAARAMVRRHGALGSFGVDHILGTLWQRPQLSRRDRSLVVLSFLCSMGDAGGEELEFHIRSGLNHGLTRVEIEEVVLQVAGYAGFPMAMAASRVVAQTWCALDEVERLPVREEAELKDDEQRWRDAQAVRSQMWRGRNAIDPEQDRTSLVGALGDVGAMAFDFAFGELWARSQLTRRDRSIVTCSILAMTRCVAELAIHTRIALNHGCSREEIDEIIVQLSGYGGFPRAVEAREAVHQVYERLDSRQATS